MLFGEQMLPKDENIYKTTLDSQVKLSNFTICVIAGYSEQCPERRAYAHLIAPRLLDAPACVG